MSKTSSSEVCDAVIAACKLVSPPLRGIMRRCYPYANLTDLSFLENERGYLAGVTNPMFAGKEAWWDILCDLENGHVTFASGNPLSRHRKRRGGSSGNSSGSSSSSSSSGGNGRFDGGGNRGSDGQLNAVDDTIYFGHVKVAERILEGIESAGFGEEWVRAQFEQHMRRLLVGQASLARMRALWQEGHDTAAGMTSRDTFEDRRKSSIFWQESPWRGNLRLRTRTVSRG